MVLTVNYLHGFTSSVYAGLSTRNDNGPEKMVFNLLSAEHNQELPLQEDAYLEVSG